MKVCVVIPIHKADPTAFELISFQQCFKILGSHPIFIVAPRGLDLIEYKKTAGNFKVKFVPPKWFSSILQYNKLKLSIFFYNLFREYEYLLTYELDAFVFRDELMEWCRQGYDYIGAPWFQGYEKPRESNEIIGVGNSGFSLRKISTMRKMIRSIIYDPLAGKTRLSHLLYIFKYPIRFMSNQVFENYTIQKNYHRNEDYFISKIAPRRFSKLKIAPVDAAIRFSFEANPRTLFKMNKDQLPMGCHAWWRYDFDFWRFHISKFGYHL